MKKLMALFLAGVLTFGLSACNNSTTQGPDDLGEDSDVETVVDDTMMEEEDMPSDEEMMEEETTEDESMMEENENMNEDTTDETMQEDTTTQN